MAAIQALMAGETFKLSGLILIQAPTDPGTSDLPFVFCKVFKQLGWRVHLWPIAEDLPFWERLRVIHRNYYDPGYRKSVNRRLRRWIRNNTPTLILLYGANYCFEPETIIYARRQHGCKVILFESNIRLWKGFQVEGLPYLDHIFVQDSYLLPLLRDTVPLKNVSLLGMGCDPEVHRPMDLSDEERKRFEAEVAFIGTPRPNRIDTLKILDGFELKLWGPNWENTELAHRVVNEPVYGVKKTKIYNATKILPNIQGTVCQVWGLTERVFEVLACGAFPLSENKPDLPLYFQVGEEIETFNDPEDLRRKTEYYLKHEDEREEIAARGRKRVLAQHTWEAKIRQMLDTIGL